MLNMYHPLSLGAGISVEFDNLFAQAEGLVELKFLLDSVVNVRPINHAAVLFSPSAALTKNGL